MSESQINSLQQNTIVLDLTFHMPMLARRESKKQVQTTGNQRWFAITKQILRSPAYDQMNSLAIFASDWVIQRSIPDPNGLLKAGCHLIPISNFESVINYLKDVQSKYAELADSFVSQYDECRKEAEQQLLDAFNESNYPTAKYMRAGCWIEVRWYDLAIPSASKIGEEFAQAEMLKAKKQWNDASQSIIYMLREQFQELVKHLAEMLGVGDDGKKRRLHPSAVSNVLDWIELFNNRNIMNDEQLKNLVDQTKFVLAGKNIDTIRDDSTLRTGLQSAMNQVTSRLDSLLVDAPRKISFED